MSEKEIFVRQVLSGKEILLTFVIASILLLTGRYCVKWPGRAREIYNYPRKDYKCFGDPPSETYFRVVGVCMLIFGAFVLYFGLRAVIDIILRKTHQ